MGSSAESIAKLDSTVRTIETKQAVLTDHVGHLEDALSVVISSQADITKLKTDIVYISQSIASLVVSQNDVVKLNADISHISDSVTSLMASNAETISLKSEVKHIGVSVNTLKANRTWLVCTILTIVIGTILTTAYTGLPTKLETKTNKVIGLIP